MKVVLIGHACAPNMGSEPGNTWNLASHLSAQHQVWVIAFPQRREQTDRHLAEHPNPNLKFIYVSPKVAIDPWDPAKGERGFRVHYLLWQREVARVVHELCNSIQPDVVHHFSLGTIKAPPLLHDLSVPVVWGPMGGGQVMPWAFRKYFNGQLTQEIARIALAKVQPIMPSLRRMCQRAAVIFANNLETLDLLHAAGAQHATFALETAVPAETIEPNVPQRHDEKRLNLLWAGRLETRKALPLGLEAIARTTMPVTLTVAGDGDKQTEWKQVAADLKIADRVRFLGRVPHTQMAQLFRESDAFLFTSLRDSTGAVVLEAMAMGLPIVTVNHQGMRTIVPDDAGAKIPVTTPADTIWAMSVALDELAADPQRRKQMAEAALRCARENTWDHRACQIADAYQTATHSARRAPPTAAAVRPDPAA